MQMLRENAQDQSNTGDSEGLGMRLHMHTGDIFYNCVHVDTHNISKTHMPVNGPFRSCVQREGSASSWLPV